MQLIARKIHIFNDLSGIQGSQKKPQSLSMMRLDAGRISRGKKFLQAFVLKRYDHSEILSCCVMRNKHRLDLIWLVRICDICQIIGL